MGEMGLMGFGLDDAELEQSGILKDVLAELNNPWGQGFGFSSFECNVNNATNATHARASPSRGARIETLRY